MMIGTAEDAMQLHKMEFHTLRVCDQCQVSIEAYKLPEHKVNRVWLFLNDVQVQSTVTLLLEHCTERMFFLKDLMYYSFDWFLAQKIEFENQILVILGDSIEKI